MYSKTDTSLHPNEEVLEAQARVCTGPHQSRPLGIKPSDPKPNKILKENNEFEIIDLHPLYLNNDRSMKRNLSKDGVHLNENGYNIWIDRVKPLIDRINTAAN